MSNTPDSSNELPGELLDLMVYKSSLKDLPPDLLLEAFRSAKRYAPSIMRDKLVLATFVTDICHAGRLDLSSVKILVDLEAAYSGKGK